MVHQLGQPIQGLKGLGATTVIGTINHLSADAQSVLALFVGNALLRKASPDNVARHIFQSAFNTRPERSNAVYVKAAVVPAKHVLDNDLALRNAYCHIYRSPAPSTDQGGVKMHSVKAVMNIRF